ncbi:unnamed protein product [Arabidopsis arenosa]|uniref:Transmembrane protein n=1 Tax=Arabidopsis arenosa TaxID=38785 RepID=A0A8S1ZQ85_ARAAE|nr:unnamed protein product [Arabidopsis arenosa]
MVKPFEFHGVEAEKAEAMRRYNNRRSFRNILRLAAVASLCYLWFPTVAISLQTAGDWFYRTGAVFITDRSVVFVFANLIVGLLFFLSGESNNKSSSSSNVEREPDLYDQYTSSSSAVIVTADDEKVVEDDDDDLHKQIVPAFDAEVEEAVTTKGIFRRTKSETSRPVMEYRKTESEKVVEDDESEKQIVPAFIPEDEEVVLDEATREVVTSPGIYRRTKSETKKEIIRPVVKYRRTESAKVVAIDRLSSEEFRLKIESFIMEKKRSLVRENDVVQCQVLGSRHGLIGSTGYGSC